MVPAHRVYLGEGGERSGAAQAVAPPYTTVLTPTGSLRAGAHVPSVPAFKAHGGQPERRHWNYLMGLWVAGHAGPAHLRFFIPEPWNGLVTENMTLGVSLLEGYLGYFLPGPLAGRNQEAPLRGLLWAVFLADWAVIALGTWGMTSAKGWYGEWFSSYQGLFAMVLAASIFLLVKSCCGEDGERAAAGAPLKLLLRGSTGAPLPSRWWSGPGSV